ncbi:MAG TPA: response regulator [Rhodoferax sp.]|nr:response regulator [Rhodoferax sp.]
MASKYKSEFLANMSHELRTPLNSLLLLAQSLSQNNSGNLTTDQVESARIIHSSGTDLLNLINEILDLSKIEAGRMELQFGSVPVADMADAARSSFAHMALVKGLSLDVLVSPDAPADLNTDYKRVEQIIRNLMSNAIKFTESGGVTLRFGRPDAAANLSRSALSPANALAISVKDTGIGIARDKHKPIFEAFQQADGSTARRFGGTGLGLTISRELANLLGGEIQLASEPGQGSTFTLHLPLAGVVQAAAPAEQARLPNPASPQRPRALASPGPSEASPRRQAYIPDDRDALAAGDQLIVVIEDDPKFAAIVLGKCHEKGFKCLAAADGETGLALIDKHLPSAVILDIRLPGMDGMMILNALKEDIRTRHIPVHMISVEDNLAESLRRGAVGHAVKPLDQERLEGVFDRLKAAAAVKPRRLLVVEDDATARRATLDLLADEGVAVDAADSGEEAIRLLRASHYDCVVLDLKLPDMDGQTVLERLEQEGISLPPVVVHTARDLTAREELNLREHAESIIVKGVRSPERLLDEVTLFLHRVVSQMPEKKRQIIANLHDADAALRDKQVLIVDDDMRTMFAVSRLLTGRGMLALKAENGERALQLLQENPAIDLVLMDIMMPVMDGYQAMQRIRAQERWRKLPIIALTAKAMPEDRQKCIAAGASDYLPKPIDPDRLFSMMRVWLYG